MTRLLAPESYGLLAIVTVVMVIVSLLADIGLRQSVVRSKRGDDVRFLDTAFSIQIVRGFALTTIIMIVAGAVGYLGRAGVFGEQTTYAQPLLPWLIGVSALSASILGFQSMKLYLIDRDLKGDLSVKVELLVQIVTMAVTIGVAIPTRSVWAIVIGGLAGNIAHVLLTRYWLPGNRDGFCWDRHAVRELLSFGRWILISSALTGLTMHGDRLVLGAVTSAENLGLYAIAVNLVGLATGIVSRISGTISLGAISHTFRTAPERLSTVLGKIRLVTDTSAIACSGFLFAIAQPLVTLLYDYRYAAAGSLLQILSFSLLFARVYLMQQVYAAIGHPRFLAIVSLSAAIALYVCLPIGLHLGGFRGAVIAIALREALILPVVWVLNSRCGLNNFRNEFIVFLAWPIGYVAGWMVIHIGQALLG